MQSDTEATVFCDPARFHPPTCAELNAKIGDYEFIEFLDRGGMGAVYKARQKRLNRIVAVKLLPPANVNRKGFANRFRREAEALARMNHPNIVSVYDSGETAEVFLYYAMELVEGPGNRGYCCSKLRNQRSVGWLNTSRHDNIRCIPRFAPGPMGRASRRQLATVPRTERRCHQ